MSLLVLNRSEILRKIDLRELVQLFLSIVLNHLIY